MAEPPCTVAIVPWPMLIALTIAAPSAPRTSPTTIQSARVRTAGTITSAHEMPAPSLVEGMRAW